MATCFVVMGFGLKTDFESGRQLDLDKSYHNVIKPGVESAGLQCIRADDIVHSGLIDVPMYEQLLKADVVIADLSTSNRNAYYELGVRHALRPRTTIIICEDGIKPPFPFDLSHVAVRLYHHMGEDIGFSETMRFRDVLKTTITQILKAEQPPPPDSPVYTFLKGLKVTTGGEEAASQGTEAVAPAVTPGGKGTLSAQMKVVDEAQRAEKFDEAKKALEKILAEARVRAAELRKAAEEARHQSPDAASLPPIAAYQDDATLIQRLALVTYKNKSAPELERLEEARQLLTPLEPHTSNDTETLGLWGAVHKRLWSKTKVVAHLDEAVRSYERGFYLRNDYYNGINFAYLLNVRAQESASPAEAIADFVQAQRVRREVLAICDRWLADNPAPDEDAVTVKAMNDYHAGKYWVLATRAEAMLGAGDADKAEQAYQEAYAMAPQSWMIDATKPQRAALEPLLVDSPLKHLKSSNS